MTTPGIHLNLANEDYHSGPGISKSGLWTIYTKTPAHYRFEEPEEKSRAALDLGTATHIALLEPETFGARVARGPVDRRGNKWTDAQAWADANGALILTEGDYERCLRIQDSGERCDVLRQVRQGAIIEVSGYATCSATGVLMRCRPDAYNPALGMILDLKTARGGGAREFQRATAEYGYHMQEAFYTDVWKLAATKPHLGMPQVAYYDGDRMDNVEAFVFVVIESAAPFLVSTYELKPSAVEEGRKAYQHALAKYATCLERERLGMPLTHAWPGYPPEPEPLDIPRWAYKLTEPED